MSAESGFLTVGRGCSEFCEKKSRFIGNIAHAETSDEARGFIAEISAKYPGASHNVYCYILRADNTIRFSDDGEPSGTAGKPALEILTRAGVKDACLVITRYFGGILLGAGGLVRAYAACAKLATENGGILKMVPCLRVKAEFSYSDWARAETVIRNSRAEIESAGYGGEVAVFLRISPEKYGEISETLKNMTAGRVKISVIEEIMRGEHANG
jgi:uncharacterized YigZ family protein